MELFNFSFYPTGVLYKTSEGASKARKLKMRVEMDEWGLVKQINPNPLTCFKPIEGWLHSNEPEDHLDEISLWLKSHLDNKELNIGVFSYKDKSLASRMMGYANNRIECVFEDTNDVSLTQTLSDPKWPEDCSDNEIISRIEAMHDDLDIFIMRHYLEHFDNLDEIIKAISDKIKEDGVIYLEIPDCSEFFKRGIPLFAWEQHKYYFTRETIRDWIDKCGFACEIRVEGKSIEPSICCRLTKKRCNKSVRREVNINKPILSSKSFKMYLESWQIMLDKEGEKYMLGIGHNSDRFMQLFGNQNIFQGLIDSDSRKEGRYLASSNKIVQRQLPALRDSEFELILGVHDRAYNALANRLSKTYKHAKISSIFKSYE